ncbi:MAG: hypothetical protein JNL51_14100 [Chitinophagaceae bacterium]|nr:hypothetical protein [Chitinophagaceae bacterium]
MLDGCVCYSARYSAASTDPVFQKLVVTAAPSMFLEHVSFFINFENFSNTRQTRFDTIYTGPIDNPVFRDIYAPVDGFVVNGGIKVKL